MGSEIPKKKQQTEDKHSTINHPRMKNIRFVQNDEVIRASINVQNQVEFNKWEDGLSKLRNFDQYYLLLPKAYSFVRKAVCGSSGTLQIDFDNYPYLLNQQIDNRRKQNNYFTETQIWYLLYGLLSAANILRKADMKVGDIQPKNIFINPQGQIKVANLCSWPNQRTNYQKLVMQNAQVYVSPQQFKLSKQGKMDIYSKNKRNSCDKYVSQSFSIGLTILQAAALVANSQLYNNKQKIFDQQQLIVRVTKLLTNNNGSTRYSKALRLAIAALCEIKPQQRLQALQLYGMLRNNESQLSNLKPCNIQIPLLKNRNKYEQIIIMATQPKHNPQTNTPVSTPTYKASIPVIPQTHNPTKNYSSITTNTNATNYITTNSIPNTYISNNNTSYVNNGVNNYSSTTTAGKYDSNSMLYHYKPSDTGFKSNLFTTNNYNNNYTPLSNNLQLPITNTSINRPNSYNYTPTPAYNYMSNPSTNAYPSTSTNTNTNAIGNKNISSNSMQVSSNPLGNINPTNIYKPSTTAHTYLQNIYSPSIPASTQNKIPTAGTPTPTYTDSIKKDYRWVNKSTNSTESKYAQYSFSNISSIPKQQKQSDNKPNQWISTLTPINSANNVGLSEDSSLNLLKRINQEIAVSKDSFGKLS